MLSLRTIFVNLVFLYLLFRAYSFVNRENKSLVLQYASAWNSSMQQLNDVQFLVTGEKAFDFTKKNVTCEKCESKLKGNLGLFFVFAALSIQYKPFLRYISIMGFFALFFQFGQKIENFTTQDYLEKYQYIVLVILFIVFRWAEPILYDEKSLKRIAGEVCKGLEEENELLRNKKSSKKNKAKKESELQAQQEQIQQSLNEKSHVHSKKEQEQVQEDESDEYYEDTKKSKQQTKTSNQYYSDEEEEEALEDKRKYEVDDDGFSVVPKKITKKVQDTRKNNQAKKKSKNDI